MALTDEERQEIYDLLDRCDYDAYCRVFDTYLREAKKCVLNMSEYSEVMNIIMEYVPIKED